MGYGKYIATGVLQGLAGNTTKWSCTIPYPLQWLWVVPLFAFMALAPDSPWYLIRKGKYKDCKINKESGIKENSRQSKDNFSIDDTHQ
ncbi:uncharacterized protein RJT20DRAFT_130983 [Scheffersomyces xylosifermentans]|uniref:uncharacterized protein n=1 Tax=Scheffersomyces xylosifermentans TaxID=1304137 RepID=UPI00315CBE05